MLDLLAFKLRKLVISNITAVVLVVVALVFVGSIDVVKLKTGGWIYPSKKVRMVHFNGQSPLSVTRLEASGWESAAG